MTMFYSVEIDHWVNGSGFDWSEGLEDGDADTVVSALEWCKSLDEPLLSQDEYDNGTDIKVTIKYWNTEEEYSNDVEPFNKSSCWASDAL